MYLSPWGTPYFNFPSGDKLLWLALRMAFVIIPNGIIPYLRSLGTPYFNPPSGDKLLWLREQDSNLQPSGYEPDELPTAPSRVIGHHVVYYHR
jgi:hypothetical protein